MLNVSKLNVFRGKTHVLRDVSFQVRQGEIFSLVGANGAGKTTLLLALSGLLPVAKGEISFDVGGSTYDLNTLDQVQRVKLGLLQCPEGRQIFSRMTVEENLLMGAFQNKDKTWISEQIKARYDTFPILADRKQLLAGTLSGGEQMMLAVARSLMSNPRLLMLDEPSLGLSPLITEQIFDIIENINTQQGVTVILVEQNATMALQMAQTGCVLADGEVVTVDQSANLLRDSSVISSYLGIDI